MLRNTRAQRQNSTLVAAPCAFAVYALIFCVWSAPVLAETDSVVGDQPAAKGLFSPSVGQKFYEIAYEMANSEDVTAEDVEQAVVFLAAILKLDSRADYILPEMIKLVSQDPQREHSKLVSYLLRNYVDESADLEVIRKAISYLLGRLNSREEREKTLEEMLRNLGSKNKVLGSELATLLGLLMTERADPEAAKPHLMQAYYSNRHNKLAFAKLVELMPEQIGPTMYLEHLRLGLRENPLSMEAALAFAQYAERLQLYKMAADAYEYSAELFGFLYPSEALPAQIYLPWAISSYNTQRSQHKCLRIASDLRQSGRFDLLLEAMAGKAAAKIGDQQRANQILRTAEGKALELIAGNRGSQERRPLVANYEQLAWFYCFASPDADKALEWANKAYSTEPNSASAASILAYSLVMNGQTEWAKPLVDNYEQNQISVLTLAQIQLAKKQQSSAIETLKSAIARDPGSLAAERARQILAEHGSEYISPVDPNIVLTELSSIFGEAVVPAFVGPEKIISVKLNMQSGEFHYGGEFGATVIVTNNSAEPFIVSDDGLFKGNIRVDATVTGDIEKEIPNLVSVKVRPALPVKPGRSIFIPLRLVTGDLRQILLGHPQASLDIEFTVYLDPMTTAGGEPTSALGWIKPARMSVKRPGVELSSRYLQNRLNSLSKGRQGQKVKVAQLFTGLLMEQDAMANREPLYNFKHADWVPPLLKSALVQTLADDDWTVKVHTMAPMVWLSLDYELISVLAENLSDTHWPVRLMTVFLLAKSQGNNFRKVLDSTAKYDSNEYVRQMAIALGGAEPQQQEQPQPDSAVPDKSAAEPVSPPVLGNSTLQP
jgi:hypothetical protein